MNTFDYLNKFGAPLQTCDQQLYEQVWTMPRVVNINKRLAELLDDRNAKRITTQQYDEEKSTLKKQLPSFTFHAHFPTGQRKADDAVLSGLVIYDADHVGDAQKYWKRCHRRLNKIAMMPHVALVHVTPSGEGLRIVFVCPRGMTIAEAQAWMASQVGGDYDSAVSDPTRCSFAVPQSYVLHYAPEVLFAPHPPESAPYMGTPPTTSPSPARAMRIIKEVETEPLFTGDDDQMLTFNGIPYATIVERLMAATGGTPQRGERNTRLYRLAYDLSTVTDGNEELLLRILPSCDLSDQEMRTLVKSACRNPYHTRSKALNSVLKQLSAVEPEVDTSTLKRMPETAWLYSTTPPPMPKRLPALVRHLESATPEPYRAAVAHAIFPPLATHLYGVEFRYVDNVLHEATLMNVLMAGTGAGKSCITKPIEKIMADIAASDLYHRQREEEWRKATLSRRSSDKPVPRPEGLAIQMIDPDITNAAFVMRMKAAAGRFLYVNMNEIELFDGLCSGKNHQQQFQIMCLAFDPGGEYGQTRAMAQAVSDKVRVHFNWNASTTVGRGLSYFADVLVSGPINRINFCTIPESEIGAPMPVYGNYDQDYELRLRPYVENLSRARGEVKCPRATKLAKQMLEACQDISSLTRDRVFENLSHRAVVIAWLKACVLYVASGCRWDSANDEFIFWSLRYDLWCKLHFFGNAIRRAMDTPNTSPSVLPNQLELLPDTFGKVDVENMRQRLHLPLKNIDAMLRQWVCRGRIKRLKDGQYQKIGTK